LDIENEVNALETLVNPVRARPLRRLKNKLKTQPNAAETVAGIELETPIRS
jgi:hypothetical protein